MFKKIVATVLMMYTAVSFAAVDVNKATVAELDAIKGIGPAISGKILDERKKGTFKDWNDFVDRVKGIGEGNAAKLSAEGLTIGGASFKGLAAPANKKDDKAMAAKEAKDAKPVAKPEEKKVDAKSAAAAAPAPAPAVEAKMTKAEEKKAKAEDKAKSNADDKAKADEKAKTKSDDKAKSDSKAKTDEKPKAAEKKADAPKATASAAKK
jgi:competence protein ComEA